MWLLFHHVLQHSGTIKATLQLREWAFPTSYGCLSSQVSLHHVLSHSPPALVLLSWEEACTGAAWYDSPEKPKFWRLLFPPDLTVNSFCSCRTSRAERVVPVSVLPQPYRASHTTVHFNLFRCITQQNQVHLYLSVGDSCATVWEVTSFGETSAQCQ